MAKTSSRAEHAVAMANEHKVRERWREVMRSRRRRETRDAIDRAARAHDDALDDREREIASLDEALDACERAHREAAEAQTRRLAAREAADDAETTGMQTRVDAELRAMRERFEAEDDAAEMTWRANVDEAMRRGEEARERDARERDARRASFEDKREEMRNQHGEDAATMKMMYENRIKDLEIALARATAPTVRLGDLGCDADRRDAEDAVDDDRAYQIIRARDEADARRFDKIARAIKRLQSGVRYWRQKTDARSSEHQAARARVSRERQRRELEREETESHAAAARASRAHTLLETCVASETAINELASTLELAKRVLRIQASESRLASGSHPAADARLREDDVDDHLPADYADAVLARYRTVHESTTHRRRRRAASTA